MSNYSFWTDIIAFLGIILLRYFLVAGGAYCLFYLIFNRSLNNRTPSLDSPSHQVIQSDIKLSILSAVVFAIAAALILSAYGEGMTRLYNESQPHQIWYFGISYIAVLILQDTYFYFTHRLFQS